MTHNLFKLRSHLTPFSILRLITSLSLLLFISCGSEGSTPSPSSDPALNSIRSLTLEGVSENSITVSWELLKTEEGAVDSTITYIVYAETNDGGKVFTKDPDTETEYTLPPNSGTPLPVDDTGKPEAEVTDLENNTPYRIVVEARSLSGGIASRSRLLAYPASSPLVDSDKVNWVGDLKVDQEKATVTWEVKEEAQSYALHATESENGFGGEVPAENIFLVICPPESLLCDGDKHAISEGKQLKYTFPIKRGIRYKIAIIPFNFRDLPGLQAVDEEGVVKTFTEEVLVQLKDETSPLGSRLEKSLEGNAREAQIEVIEAGPPVDLELDPTGNTITASWGHGEGAEYYYASISSNAGVNAATNIIDRYGAGGRFTGGGYVGFSNLTANTPYTVTVESFTVIDNVTNRGGSVSGRVSTVAAEVVLDVPVQVVAEDLTLTNQGAGELGITWNTPETNSVVGYNVFYWAGETPPAKPQYVAVKGKTDLAFTVHPGSYKVRVDVLSSYPGQEVVAGEVGSVAIYGKPSPPRGLGVVFSEGSFVNIDNKLYATGYPFTHTEADTVAEAGGPLSDVFYHYRYRVAGGDWGSYTDIAKDSVIDLLVDDLRDVDVVKAGYGKKYEVELVASNDGGFISESRTLGFTYKSFPEPFNHSEESGYLTVAPGDRSLTVTWSDVTELNGSTVADYTVVLSGNPYALPVQSSNTTERRVVFEGLENNQPYFITVIPHGRVTGNLLTALSRFTGYTIGDPIVAGSTEASLLSAYTGVPVSYTPQGAPEEVIDLAVTAGEDQATVTWEGPTNGSPATEYELQYLEGVTNSLKYINVSVDDSDAELSGLSWEGATTVPVPTNSTGNVNYSTVVSNLNVTSATNVFRVRGVRVDDSGEEWSGAYRYYALGTDSSQPPDPVENLVFFDHKSNSFTVSWTEPDPGKDENGQDATLVGYQVSWGTTPESLEDTFGIDNADTLSYTITGLAHGTRYYVRVEAKNDNEEGANYSLGTTGSTYTIKPPGEVDGSTITYSGHTTNGFTVSWDAVDAGYGSEGPDRALPSVVYSIERKQGGSWQLVDRSDYTATTETLTGLTPGTEYQVRVTANNDFGSAPPTEGGETWTLSLPGPVVDPEVSEPSYDPNNHRGGFTVSWTPPSDTDTGLAASGEYASLSGYQVSYAEVVNDDVMEYASVSLEATETEYEFKDLKTNTKYDIRIQAKTEAGTGIGNHVSGWVPSLPGAVSPYSIVFTKATTTTIDITWTAVTWGRAGGGSPDTTPTTYRVEVSSDEETYTVVEDDYTINNITVTGLSSSTTYWARITAKNVWGEVPTTSTVTGTTTATDATPPSPVEDLKVDSFTTDQVVLSWSVPTNTGGSGVSIDGYLVKYEQTPGRFSKIDENSEGVRLAQALTGTTATVIGLSAGTTYTFLVVASNSANAIGPDEEATPIEQTTKPVPPGNLKLAQCAKTTSLELTWDASPGATSYKLYRGSTEIPGITTTSYTDTNLTANMTYTYKVQACKDTVCSDDSASSEIATISDKSFKSIIDSGRIPTDLTRYDERSQEILSYYKNQAGAPLVLKYVKPGGAGTEDGSSFDHAAKNLKTILDGIYKKDSPDVYVVFLTGGNYKAGEAMSMKQNTAIIGGVDECLNPSDTVTALDGEGKYRVFNNDVFSLALLYGVTVTNGSADRGGGMYNGNSSLGLVRVTFSGNSATSSGGGMFSTGAVLSLVEVTFSGNTANLGGGMFNEGSSPSLVGVTFSGNSATDEGGGMHNKTRSLPSLEKVTFSGNTANEGGGMYNTDSSPSLEGVTFSGNSANHGGGMFNENSSPPLEGVTFSGNTAKSFGGGMANFQSTPSLEGVTFSGNTADEGGGMHNTTKSSPILKGVTFSENTANKFGGGMYNGNSSPTLIGVTFSGNTATNNIHGHGGGMYNWSSSPTLEGVTFSGNTATNNGGGMYNGNSSPILMGVTFFDNTAKGGGGMYNDNNGQPGPLIINGIFWTNTASTGPQFYLYNYHTDQENLRIYNSIVEGGTGTLTSGGVNTSVNQGGFRSHGGSAPVVISFSNIIDKDPGLYELADNSGAVWTHAITSTSPAVNEGLYVKKSGSTFYYSADNSTWYTEPDLATSITPPTDAEYLTDATGYPRTGRPDLGAYEDR